MMTKNHMPESAMPIGIGEPRSGFGSGLGFSVVTEQSGWAPPARVGAIGARPAAFNTVRFSEKLLEASGISVETLDLSELLEVTPAS